MMGNFFPINILVLLSLSTARSDLQLTIVHDNDIHSRFPPVTEQSSLCVPWKEKCMAGVARLMHMVEEVTANRSNKVIHLSAGDFYQGSIWYSQFKSEIVIDYVFKMNYEAVTLGNHEFDDGVEGLLPYLKEARLKSVPVVCSNLNISNEPRYNGLIEKSIIRTYNGHRVGYVGYVLPSTKDLSSPGNTTEFEDEIEALQVQVDKLKAQGVNIIIALGHSGYQRDLEIANAIPDIDIIVGGHSNTFLWPGTIDENAPPPSIEKPVAPYPTVVENGKQKTLVVQAYAFSKYLGVLDVTFDDSGSITKYSGEPIFLSENVSQETSTNLIAMNNRYFERASSFFTTVGRTAVLLEGREVECRMRECLLGNVIADAYVYSYLSGEANTASWTQYPIAIVPGGGIRSSIDVLARRGEITRGDILNVCPFSNDLVAFNVTGEQLFQVFEHSVSAWTADMHQLEGRFLQVSGIRVVYDCTKAPGNRVKSLKARCGRCTSPRYHDVQANSMYTVVTSEYVRGGGDGYLMLKGTPEIKGAPKANDFDSLIKYFREHGITVAEIEGRTTFDPVISSRSIKVSASSVTLILSVMCCTLLQV